MASPVEIAWAAGIFEGEGSFVFGRGHSVIISVQMTDEDIVRRMYQVMGVGTITGPYEYRENKPTWCWRVFKAADIKTIIENWYPILGERRKVRADEALARIELYGTYPRREFCKLRGHPFTPENTYISPKSQNRACLACMTIYRAARNRRKTTV